MAVVRGINGSFAYDLSQGFKSALPAFALDSSLAPCGLQLPADFNNTILNYWMYNTDNTQLDFSHHSAGNNGSLEAYFYARVALGDLASPEWHELVPVTRVRGIGDNLIWRSTVAVPAAWARKRALVQKLVFTFTGNATDPKNLSIRYSCNPHTFTSLRFGNEVPQSEYISLEPVQSFDLVRLNLAAPIPYRHGSDKGISTQTALPTVTYTRSAPTATMTVGCTDKSIRGVQIVGIVAGVLGLCFLLVCCGMCHSKRRKRAQGQEPKPGSRLLQYSSGAPGFPSNDASPTTATTSRPAGPDSTAEPLLPAYSEGDSRANQTLTIPPPYRPRDADGHTV